MTEILLTTGSRETKLVLRTTARLRSTGKSLGLKQPFRKRMSETLYIAETDQALCKSKCRSHAPLLKMRPELHRLPGRTNPCPTILIWCRIFARSQSTFFLKPLAGRPRACGARLQREPTGRPPPAWCQALRVQQFTTNANLALRPTMSRRVTTSYRTVNFA